MYSNYFFPVCGLLFHFLNGAFQRVEVLNFMHSNLFIFFLMANSSFTSLRNIFLSQDLEDILLCFFFSESLLDTFYI